MGIPTDFLERDLEDIVFENRDLVQSRGLPKFRQQVFRQFVLPSGKKLDIFTFDLIDGCILFDIWELKRDVINMEALSQAYNYLNEIVGNIGDNFKSWSAKIIMVGRRYEPTIGLCDALEFEIQMLKIYTNEKYNYKSSADFLPQGYCKTPVMCSCGC